MSRAILALLLAAASLLLAPARPALAQEIVQVTANLPPYTIEPPAPRPGFAYELVGLAHQRIGLPFHPQFLPWPRAQAIARADANVLIFGLGREPSREANYRWIAPLLELKTMVIRLGDATPVETLDQARGIGSIGVTQDTPQAEFLAKSGLPNIDSASNEVINAKKLVAGRIDAWYTTETRARYLLKQEGYSGRIVPGTPLHADFIWLAASRDFPDDIETRLRSAIETIKTEAVYGEIYDRYFGP